jgi:hypothetical protein
MKTRKSRKAIDAATDTPDIDIDRITLLSDYILFQKCQRDHERDETGKVLVYLPQEVQDATQWCQIVKIGPKCRYLTNDMVQGTRMFMHIPQHEEKKWNKIAEDLFIISESLVDKKKTELKPFVYVEES